jgi:tRNA wybutosine-synthesizing protein 2
MWSKGNTTERMRIAKLVNKNETVMDMFAGIGYFSIPIAIHSKVKKVISIEINPNSFEYLLKNIELNKVQNIISPYLGDCNKIAKNFKVDRIIMGYVKTTHHYLSSAISALNDGGILHYHETVPNKLIKTRPITRVKKIAENKEIELLNIKNIKRYSPGVSHVVLDIKITEKN